MYFFAFFVTWSSRSPRQPSQLPSPTNRGNRNFLNEVLWIYENRIFKLRPAVKNEYVNDHRNYEHYWKTNQTCTRFKPTTSAIPVQCSTNWTNKPTGSWAFCWFVINPRVMNMWEWIYENHIFELRLKEWICEWSSQLWTLLKQSWSCDDHSHIMANCSLILLLKLPLESLHVVTQW